jgi:hypothetical protein
MSSHNDGLHLTNFMMKYSFSVKVFSAWTFYGTYTYGWMKMYVKALCGVKASEKREKDNGKIEE